MAMALSGVEWRPKAPARSPSSVITCHVGHMATMPLQLLLLATTRILALSLAPSLRLCNLGISGISGAAATPACCRLLDSPRVAEAFYPRSPRPSPAWSSSLWLICQLCRLFFAQFILDFRFGVLHLVRGIWGLREIMVNQ